MCMSVFYCLDFSIQISSSASRPAGKRRNTTLDRLVSLTGCKSLAAKLAAWLGVGSAIALSRRTQAGRFSIPREPLPLLLLLLLLLQLLLRPLG